MNKKLLISMFAAILLISTVFAQPYKNTPEYKAAEKKVGTLSIFNEVLNDYEEIASEGDATMVIHLMGVIAEKYQKNKYFSPDHFPEIVQKDKEITNSLKKLIERYKLDNELVKKTITDYELTTLDGKSLTANNVDLSIYKYPLFYTKGISATFLIFLYLVVTLFVFNIIRMIFNKEARSLKGFFGSGFFSWFRKKYFFKLRSRLFFQAEKEEKTINEVFGLKKILIEKNNSNLDKLFSMIKSKQGIFTKEDIANLWKDEVKEFERNWASILHKNIEKANQTLEKVINKLERYFSLFEKRFRKRFNKTLEKDAEMIRYIEERLYRTTGATFDLEGEKPVYMGAGKISDDFRRNIEDIKRTLLDEHRLLNATISPEQNKLANGLRVFKSLLRVENGLIKREEEILEALSTGAIKGTDLEDIIKTLKSIIREIDENYRKQKEVMGKIQDLETKIGEKTDDITKREILLERTKKITNEMLEHPRKYFRDEPAIYPLPLKNLNGVTIKRSITNIGMLRKGVEREIYSKHKELLIDDIALYMMLKPRGGTSELEKWVREACENPDLADEIKGIIKEERIPEELETVAVEVWGEKGFNETTRVPKELNDLLAKLEKSRKDVSEAIDDAYGNVKSE